MKMTHTHTKDECLEALVSAIFAIIDRSGRNQSDIEKD